MVPLEASIPGGETLGSPGVLPAPTALRAPLALVPPLAPPERAVAGQVPRSRVGPKASCPQAPVASARSARLPCAGGAQICWAGANTSRGKCRFRNLRKLSKAQQVSAAENREIGGTLVSFYWNALGVVNSRPKLPALFCDRVPQSRVPPADTHCGKPCRASLRVAMHGYPCQLATRAPPAIPSQPSSTPACLWNRISTTC